MPRLSKYKIKKFWRTLFRPKCYGKYDPREPLNECIRKYYKDSTAEKKVLPCEHYDDCLSEACRRLKIKDNAGDVL